MANKLVKTDDLVARLREHGEFWREDSLMGGLVKDAKLAATTLATLQAKLVEKDAEIKRLQEWHGEQFMRCGEALQRAARAEASLARLQAERDEDAHRTIADLASKLGCANDAKTVFRAALALSKKDETNG